MPPSLLVQVLVHVRLYTQALTGQGGLKVNNLLQHSAEAVQAVRNLVCALIQYVDLHLAPLPQSIQRAVQGLLVGHRHVIAHQIAHQSMEVLVLLDAD